MSRSRGCDILRHPWYTHSVHLTTTAVGLAFTEVFRAQVWRIFAVQKTLVALRKCIKPTMDPFSCAQDAANFLRSNRVAC